MTNPYGPPSGPQPQQPYPQSGGPMAPPGTPVSQHPGYGAAMPGQMDQVQPNPYFGTAYPGTSGMRKVNGLAIASMVVSLCSIVVFYGALLVGLVGAILGHVARRQIKTRPDMYDGDGMALTGIIVGWITFGGWALVLGVLIGFGVWASTMVSTF